MDVVDDMNVYDFSRYSEEYICFDCLKNTDLKQYFQETAKRLSGAKCYICGRGGKKVISLELLLSYIQESISKEYERADSQLFFDSSEGGCQGFHIDAYDLTEELLGDEHQKLKEIIQNDVLKNEIWTDINSKNGIEEDFLHWFWGKFVRLIKTKYRYTFLALNTYPADVREFSPNDSPVNTLASLCNIMKTLNLFQTLPIGTKLYRGRISKHILTQVSEICPPLAQDTQENRMNPVGIPMFYCSRSKDSLKYELNWKGENILHVATFSTLKALTVLNLSSLFPTVSIFSENSDLNPTIRFLNSFIREISQPVNKESQKATQVTNYIPTQILTEYFRYFLKTTDNKSIDGICYPSSRKEGAVNYVLFFGQEAFEGVSNMNTAAFKMDNIESIPPKNGGEEKKDLESFFLE